MIEQILLEYLQENIDIPVYLEIPENVDTTEFIIFEKTSSSCSNYLNSSTIAIQSYADSMYRAAEINYEIKNIMVNFNSLDEISSCKLNSDYNFTDTKKRIYRYQAVFDIVHY